MVPDDFPDIMPTNRYHMQRPKEAFNSVGDATLEADNSEPEEQLTMQLRSELEITNTGEHRLCSIAV